MKASTAWNYRPFAPMDRQEDTLLPCIGRLAPYDDRIELYWFDIVENSGPHTLLWCVRGTAIWQTESLQNNSFTLRGIVAGQTYELCIRREKDGVCGKIRLAECAAVPGIIVNYLHPEDPVYALSGQSLCSPSIVRLPSGRLITSMDVFSGNEPQNLTLLMKSDDNGETWEHLTELFPCFWGKLFVHRGRLYMFANATEYGDLLIGRSDDGGFTWTAPVHLFPGSGCNRKPGPHKAPMPFVSHHGRLWTAVDFGSWLCGGHANGHVSVDENADLLDPESWLCSGFLHTDDGWPGMAEGVSNGCIEGNMLVGPDGGLYNLLRYCIGNANPRFGRGVLLKVDPENPEKAPVFDRVISFNGFSNSKFDVVFDAQSKTYLAAVNEITDPAKPTARTVLSLAVSHDFIHWNYVHRIVDASAGDEAVTGFQYPCLLIDGDDLLCLSRTALNHPKNFHDANYQTLYRIQNFRTFCIPASPEVS